MKKILSIICSFTILCLCFTGCAGQESAEPLSPTQAPPPTVSVTETPTEPPTEAPTEPPLQTYPLNVGKAYLDYATAPPDIIYNTLGSENGLAGSIYAFDGTVVSIEPVDAGGTYMDFVKVETDDGMILILNSYPAIYKLVKNSYGEYQAKSMYADNPDYYIVPEIGEAGNFITVYLGFSEAENMPAVVLGASADIYSMEELEDPVAAALNNGLNTNQ